MPSPVAIAAACADDIPVVQRLADTIWRQHYASIISRAQIDYMLGRGYTREALAAFLDRTDRGLLLAKVDAAAVGFAAWYAIAGADEAKLDRLYVLPARQREGIGGALIGAVEAAARVAGASTLILNVNKHNAQAIAAYLRHGFAVREAVVVPIGEGYVMDDYVLARPISRPEGA
jgi:ribosomal protein S18 acetylase RimI-like enzyme